MKNLNFKPFIMLLAVSLLVFSCGDDEDPGPDIRVGFNYTPDAPVAGQEISFTNASTGGSTYAWDFGDGTISTTENPTHTYEAAGTYNVTLTLDDNQNLEYAEEVTVAPPTPVITFDPNPIQQGVPVTLVATVYNPNDAQVQWTWEFPAEGWSSDDIDDNGVATGDTVVVTFAEANPALPISVTALIDGADLEASASLTVNAQLAKTLWIAQKDGNLWSKRIFLEGEAELEDSGIPSGARPLTMDFADDRLYVFDGGSTITFSADAETSPGQIFSMNFDATGYTTHITFSDQPYDDAFFGSVDGTDLIFTDRRNDITVLPISTVNAEWNPENGDVNPIEFPALVTNNQLGYYSAFAANIADYSGPTYGFGAVNGTVERRDGVYWWAKNSNHRGLYRFTADDIGVIDAIPDEGAILGDYAVRAFAIDDENGKIYFSSNNPNIAFYVADLDGSNVTVIDDAPADAEGGGNERTYITDIAIDNESGYVYWAYRGPNDPDLETNPTYESGIKRYRLDGSGEVEYFIQGVEAYGIAIDDTKR